MNSHGKELSLRHIATPEEILDQLRTNTTGLSEEEARVRLHLHGLNRLPEAPPVGWWKIVARQFQSPLIYFLVLVAVVAFCIHPDNPTDSLFIVAVLCLNAAIGAYQEGKAEQSSRALQKLLQGDK